MSVWDEAETLGQIEPTPSKASVWDQAETLETSALGAFGRSAAREAPSAVGGIVSGGLASLGLTAAGILAPEITIPGVLAAGLFGAYGTKKVQEKVIETAEGEEGLKQYHTQEKADVEQHPIASFLGEILPTALAFKPSVKNVFTAGQFARELLGAGGREEAKRVFLNPENAGKAANLLNVGVNTGVATGQELYSTVQTGNFDPLSFAARVGASALLNQPTALGHALNFTGTTQHQEPVSESDLPIHPDQPQAAIPQAEPASEPSQVIPPQSQEKLMPEASATIEAQMQWLEDGKRRAVYVPQGTEDVSVPEGMKELKTDQGVFYYNPEKITGDEISKAVTENRIGDVLDYGISEKPQESIGAVVVRSPEGLEKQSVLTDEANLSKVMEAARKVADPNDTITLENPEKVISERGMTRTNEPVGEIPSVTDKPLVSEGEILKKSSDLAKLSQAVRSLDTDGSLPERLSISRRIAEAITPAKNVFQRSLIGAKSTYEALYSTVMQPPKFTDFKQSLGEWLGQAQIRDYELMKFSKDIKSYVPDPVRREAITNFIQAGGDARVLAERASLTKDSRLRRGYELALKLTDAEKNLAHSIGQYFESMLKDGMDAGLIKHGVENYISQIWSKDTLAVNRLRGEIEMGMLNKNFKFAKERFYQSFFEGEQEGNIPRTKDVGSIIAMYDQSFRQAIAARAFIKQLTEQVKAPDGRPLVVLSGAASPSEEGTAALFIHPQAKPKEFGDYMPLDHPSLRGWKWVEMDGATGKNVFTQGQALLHPEIYSHMKAVFSRSALREIPGVKQFLNLQSIVKQNMLSLSAFHMVQEAEHAIGYRINPFKIPELDFNNPKQVDLVTHGLQVSSFHAAQEFSEGLTGGSKAIVNKLPFIGEPLQKAQDFLFNEYIPRLKMKTALELFDRNMERYSGELAKGKITKDQILELSANQANAAYGEMNYKYMGRSATTQDFFRLFALAPDFLEARLKSVGQAFTKYGAEQRHNFLVLGLGTYVTARILNKLTDDDYHWNNPFHIYFRGKAYGFRIIPEDIYNMTKDPLRFWRGRISPAASFLTDLITGTDYRGVKILTSQVLKNAATSWIPSGIAKAGDKSFADTILSQSGVQVRNESNVTQMYEQARDFNKKTGFKQDIVDQAHVSKFKELKTQLQLGDMAAARKEYLRLAQDINIKDLQRSLQKSFDTHGTFTGSKAQERAFFQSLDPRQRQRYNDAIKERFDLVNRLRQVTAMARPDLERAMMERDLVAR